MDTIGFFTSEEKKLFFSKYRLLLRNLYSFLEREDIRKMKELMKRVINHLNLATALMTNG